MRSLSAQWKFVACVRWLDEHPEATYIPTKATMKLEALKDKDFKLGTFLDSVKHGQCASALQVALVQYADNARFVKSFTENLTVDNSALVTTWFAENATTMPTNHGKVLNRTEGKTTNYRLQHGFTRMFLVRCEKPSNKNNLRLLSMILSRISLLSVPIEHVSLLSLNSITNKRFSLSMHVQ